MTHFKSINPFNLELIAEYRTHSISEVQKKIENADTSFQEWKNSSSEFRSDCLLKLASTFRKKKTTYAALITSEMGKPITEALAEMEKCAATCEYYAYHLDTLLQNKNLASNASRTYVRYQPLGTILGIMPWNFPFWQAIRFAIPCIAAGNTILLKHAPNVTGCSIALENAFAESGFPACIYQSLVVENEKVAYILQDFRVKGVSVTGSEKAGKAVASLAGANIKKSVLELGGSDPFIILQDADIEKAATIGLQSRLQNAGQVCVSAKRFIVEANVKDAFVDAIQKQLPAWRPNDPTLPSTKLGPMARIDLAENIERQYYQTLEQGAKSLTDFTRTGCMVAPMLLDNVPSKSVAFQEETFGPLIAICSVKDAEEALYVANDTPFGLGASIFSNDVAKAEDLASKINAGIVFVNEMVKSDPSYPIGGIQLSGYGRELFNFGMHEFMNAKVIRVP